MKNFSLYIIASVCILSGVVFGAHAVRAASLTVVRDLITRSAPSVASNHTIEFTVSNAVPPSGRIVITPEADDFTIPGTFDYTDVDFAYSTTSGSTYTERSLAATANATDDGVAVLGSTNGSVTITLNATTGLNAGERVRIKLGTHAVVGTTGNVAITNPDTLGSYRIGIATRTSTGDMIDSAIAMIAIIAPVETLSYPPPIPPLRFNGLPSGQIASGNAVIEISLNTDEVATCRYATTTGVLYDNMTNTFTAASGGTTHYRIISGHQDDTAYTYYVRCSDYGGSENEDDYAISFSLAETSATSTSGSGGSSGSSGSSGTGTGAGSGNGPGGTGTGGSGSGGIGTVPDGSSVLYLATMRLSGRTAPQSMVTVLKDGVKAVSIPAQADGTFSTMINGLERGTYTFVVFSEDGGGRKTSAISSTISVSQGTNNTLENLTLPPTIAMESDQIDIGDTVRVFGTALPGHEVELEVRPQSGSSLGETKRLVTTAISGVAGQPEGAWEIVVDTAGFRQDTYVVKAKTVIATSTQTKTAYSSTLFLGVGEEASPDLAIRADINGDNKINLTDFSIMLTFWNSSNDAADINGDGIINLADFSILLFNWTG